MDENELFLAKYWGKTWGLPENAAILEAIPDMGRSGKMEEE